MDFKSLIPFGRTTGLTRGAGDLDPFLGFRRDMDRLFEDFARDWSAPALRAGSDFLSPRVDVAETEAGLELTAELPGVDAKDIELDLADGMLTLKASTEAAKEEKDEKKHYHLVERSSGTFMRRFALPFEVDAAKAEAAFDKGVLRVKVPRAPSTEKPSTRVAIKAA